MRKTSDDQEQAERLARLEEQVLEVRRRVKSLETMIFGALVGIAGIVGSFIVSLVLKKP